MSFTRLASASLMTVALLGALTACGSGGLSASASCADWNNADINAQGTYIVGQEKAGVAGLNRWTGYADGEIGRYCQNDPTANLGAITTKVAKE